MFLNRKPSQDAASPESSHGGPVYDARIDPAVDGPAVLVSERLLQARDAHLFYHKTTAARLYSHAFDPQPAPSVYLVAQLAAQRDQIETVVQRKALPPYPGVALGHVPGFHRAPDTSPVVGHPGPRTHHAHRVEPSRVTRARFGH